jgi:hypothetical protein
MGCSIDLQVIALSQCIHSLSHTRPHKPAQPTLDCFQNGAQLMLYRVPPAGLLPFSMQRAGQEQQRPAQQTTQQQRWSQLREPPRVRAQLPLAQVLLVPVQPRPSPLQWCHQWRLHMSAQQRSGRMQRGQSRSRCSEPSAGLGPGCLCVHRTYSRIWEKVRVDDASSKRSVHEGGGPLGAVQRSCRCVLLDQLLEKLAGTATHLCTPPAWR